MGDSALVFVQNPLLLTASSEPQPDIMLLKPRADFYRSAHPRPEDFLLIIEVADTTLAYDRDIKVPLYARHAIPEAWLVDLENKRLHVFTSPSDTGYLEIPFARAARRALHGRTVRLPCRCWGALLARR